MPWIPELFSAPVLEHLQEKLRRDVLVTVPYFDGFMAGEPDALIESFAGEPEVHDPIRGRVKGRRAFETFMVEMRAWLEQRHVSVEDAGHVVTGPGGFGEVVLHLDGAAGRVDVPVAIVSEREADGRIGELRVYSSNWPLAGRHAIRPPLLQPDPQLQAPDVVGDYQRALAGGDAGAIVAAFEADGYAREPAGGRYLHRGPDGLRAFYRRLFSNGGGLPLEHCGLVDDGHACALEYNVVRWGKTDLPPQAGVMVHVRGEDGKLAAVRVYDDADPPLGVET